MIYVVVPKEHSTDQDYCNKLQDFMFSQGYKWTIANRPDGYESHPCVVAYYGSHKYLTHWSEQDIEDYDESLERCIRHAEKYGYALIANPLEPSYTIDLESVA